jgi:hypothetical protein
VSAPGPRLRRGFVVAVVVAVAMFVGIIGLVVVAVVGLDDEPSGDGLERSIDVAAPATAQAVAPDAAATAASASAVDDTAGTGAAATDRDAFGEVTTTAAPAPVETVQPVTDLEAPDTDVELPTAGSDPTEFPALVTTAPPPPTFAAVPVAELGPDDVPELSGWTVDSRGDDHLALTREGEVIDVFVDVEAGTADEAVEWLLRRADGDLADLTTSPHVLLGSPNDRFRTVVGSQFAASDARQHGTSTVSGSVVAGARPDGTAVVVAVTRPSTSSGAELRADGELLQAILAHL